MSTFSNADTGSKPADPYVQANQDEPILADKIQTLSNFISTCKFGMMTTRDPPTGRLVSRCMAVAAKESNGVDLLFFTNTESNKTNELKDDPHTNVSFYDPMGQWASVSGNATIETDRSLVAKHYTPTLKAWLGDLGDGVHDGSENDPRIGIIRIRTDTANYTANEKSILGRAYEVAKGVATGAPASINKLRHVTDKELEEWRKTA